MTISRHSDNGKFYIERPHQRYTKPLFNSPELTCLRRQNDNKTCPARSTLFEFTPSLRFNPLVAACGCPALVSFVPATITIIFGISIEEESLNRTFLTDFQTLTATRTGFAGLIREIPVLMGANTRRHIETKRPL